VAYDGLTVEGVLGPRGALSSAIAGYEHRPQQLALAHAVNDALRDGRHLVAEAGTGTGKTLGYLVPAVLSGKRVILSTATRTLQEQLFLKAVPLLRDVVGLSFEAAMLQGRSNYLCAHRFEAFDAQPLFGKPETAAQWQTVRRWALSTETGERHETPVSEAWEAWPQLTTTPEACLGSACPHFQGCFVTKARRRAEEAQIVIVNHALFFADLTLRSRGEGLGLGILPSYDAVIFDEAHALDDVATDHFGFALSAGRLTSLADDTLAAVSANTPAGQLLTDVSLTLRQATHTFFESVAPALGLQDGKEQRLDATLVEPLRPHGVVLLESIAAVAAACDSEAPEVAPLKRRAVELGAGLESLLSADDASQVYWVQQRGDSARRLTLRQAPIDAGEALAQTLLADVKSAIFTSATLAVGKGFDYALSRFGLTSKTARTLQVPSPFDYLRQCALYVPRHLPEPNAPGWTQAFADEVEQLLALTDGRAFILFTSLRHMDQVHALVSPRVSRRCWRQGELPRRQLLEAFVAEPSVLFASQSFWEGVDVPGEALSLVVIDRLPFAPPTEPLAAARIEAARARGEQPFDSLQVPQAALSLRQGFGRLIRTATDRGVVAVGDVRLLTKRYGKTFLASLPLSQRFSRRPDVERWWRRE
jgi:ATP-dependent DNA helicase DinG